jgi:hypothetical protein
MSDISLPLRTQGQPPRISNCACIAKVKPHFHYMKIPDEALASLSADLVSLELPHRLADVHSLPRHAVVPTINARISRPLASDAEFGRRRLRDAELDEEPVCHIAPNASYLLYISGEDAESWTFLEPHLGISQHGSSCR